MTPFPRRLAVALAACGFLIVAGCSSDDANLYNVLGLGEEDTGPPPETLDEDGKPLAQAGAEGEGTTVDASAQPAAAPQTAEGRETIDLTSVEIFLDAGAVPGEPAAAEAEFRCYRAVDARVSVQIQRGKIAAPDPSRAGERACVYAALCDVLDGQANYFANLMAASRAAVQSGASSEGDHAQQQAFADTCRALPGFGPDMMLQEEAVFVEAARTRDDLRGMYAGN